ncbi:hypothetical protein FJV83_07660 [Mesorhizobium sp. WSM4307]|nr:hypothetical protein FJV81_18340 [Mesorhizobium sp. WSM4315]TRC79463.1 hypothetical protein FJV80_23780 [Mesorhizobium sp. WSM4310]TRC86279.1 hypothetical protein FJV83_07660 [Mesorhizobium sp. WSM4307]TRC99469.1 hypothetical protein FJV82_22865 [Mesorhizobium sp. WSM4305]
MGGFGRPFLFLQRLTVRVSSVDALHSRRRSGSSFQGNAEPLRLFILTQFPRESATRFSRENRLTLCLEVFYITA